MKDAPLVTGNFSVQLTCTDKRVITMTGYVFDKDDTHTISQRIDDVMDVLDRQHIRADIQNKEAQKEAIEGGIIAADKHVEQIIADYPQGSTKKMPTNLKATVDQHTNNTRAAINQIKALEAAIARGKEKIRLNGKAQDI